MRIAFATLIFLVASSFAGHADACTQILYDVELEPAAVANEMLENAPTVELMHVVSREAVSADRAYAELYATPIYRFRFETAEVLKGRSRGRLELYGVGTDARYANLADVEIPQRNALWWTGRHGYGWLQGSAILDPSDAGSIACRQPFAFEVGATYLIFRGDDGRLLGPSQWFRRPDRQRPVIEIVASVDDPWLREVRAAIAERGEGPETFWTALFQIIFGNRRAE